MQAYDTLMENSNGTWSVIDYGVTHLGPSISPSQGVLVELLLTLMLVMVFIHTTMEKTEYRPIAPLAVGLALVAGVLARLVSWLLLLAVGNLPGDHRFVVTDEGHTGNTSLAEEIGQGSPW